MRRFVVVGHEAITTADFSLDDLAGATGRLDILLRCINSAFMLSHGLRKDTELYLSLLGPPGPSKVIRLVGSQMRYLNPDERSTASLVRKALALEFEGQSTPGIYVHVMGLGELLRELRGSLAYLREDGEDLRATELTSDSSFLLSDHKDLTRQEEATVMGLEPKLVSVGPAPLHTDHCITIVHNELDRRGL